MAAPSERQAVEAFADLIEDELNVKEVRLLDRSVEAVSHTLKPLPKQLGQKYGNVFPAIQEAILQADPETGARSLLAGQPIRGAGWQIPPTTFCRMRWKSALRLRKGLPWRKRALRGRPRHGLTPELRQEGLARKVVRRVQELRKTADLDVADRIQLYVSGSEIVSAAVRAHQDYVMAETLATSLEFASRSRRGAGSRSRC